MKKWLDRCPAFMRRLWCQLAISYTVLAFCAMTLIMIMLYGANDYMDFRSAITPANVEKLVAGEMLSVAQAIRDAENSAWKNKALDSIRQKLTNMEQGDGATIYRITNSSHPEVYIQIADGHDRVLISSPSQLPDNVADQFAQHSMKPAAVRDVRLLVENGPILVDMPITGDGDKIIGRLRLMFIAEFSLWVQLQSILAFLLMAWDMLIICSLPIGITCGLIASRYVTRQLRRMNEVTESWRRGDFKERIALPNDDVLIRHSQHLNDMAQDLEMYMGLKQNLAISDERNRLARDLHDTVKQKLFALGLQLATAKSKPAVMEAAREHILEAEAITREAQHDLMEIITQLRPADASEFSFYKRLRMIADDFERRFAVSIVLNGFDGIQPNPLVEHQLLRIVQESLMNAVRHGHASNIVITSKVDQAVVMLTISDNGSGFDASKITQGFGITSMRDRMRDLPHGAFVMRSTPGAGTEITLSWKPE